MIRNGLAQPLLTPKMSGWERPGSLELPGHWQGEKGLKKWGEKWGNRSKGVHGWNEEEGMQGSIPSPAFLSLHPQEHDGVWWHPLGSPHAAPLLHPVLALAPR